MSYFESALGTLRKYADFKGRASRQEFWTFFVFVILTQALARVLDLFLGSRGMMPGPIYGLVALALLIPQIAVTVRRLHDVGRPGTDAVLPFVLLIAAPFVIFFGGFIGRIVQMGFLGVTMLLFAGLLMKLVKKGSSIPNRYGAAPTAFSFAR